MLLRIRFGEGFLFLSLSRTGFGEGVLLPILARTGLGVAGTDAGADAGPWTRGWTDALGTAKLVRAPPRVE